MSDRGEAKIGDAWMTGVIHKNVRLVRCEYLDKRISRKTTYSLEVPMDDIAGVEVAEALGDTKKLVKEVSVR